ncbi:hypothetical protein [Paenibacillus wynnii]|uniref:hypothetical protein n=1 Tax=Paenibacillus wynnii TaxID=268407 RepID=UPI002792F195|nr:hypothetical protein [Paenibacillus wynnii]MDQ0194595.1 hypothetical protein [Paenibacillus wynnii]
MKVNSFELMSWISGKTSAGLSAIQSQKLFLNGVLFSSNIPSVYTIGNLIQIEICSECFEPECSSSGYVQVFGEDELIIWKEPLNEISDIREDPVNELIHGTVFWEKELFYSFMNEVMNNNSVHIERLSIKQAIDLWRLNALSSISFPRYYDFDRLEEDIMGFYSSELSSEETKHLYFKSKNNLLKLISNINSIRIVTIDENAIKLIAMIETDPYKEWNCLYINDDKIIYPIGDNYGFYINEILIR